MWSNLLASGLTPPNRTYTEPVSFLAASSKQDSDIGDKAEAKKRWRTCLERGKIIKSHIQSLGMDVSKVGKNVITSPAKMQTVQSIQDLKREQQSILRESSMVNGSFLPLWDDTHVPGWEETVSAEAGPSKRYGRQPALNRDQEAYQPTWEPRMKIPRRSCTPSCFDNEAEAVKVEQGMGANCSVVVGLEQCLKHNIKFHRNVSLLASMRS
jgi:hypothetical protein